MHHIPFYAYSIIKVFSFATSQSKTLDVSAVPSSPSKLSVSLNLLTQLGQLSTPHSYQNPPVPPHCHTKWSHPLRLAIASTSPAWLTFRPSFSQLPKKTFPALFCVKFPQQCIQTPQHSTQIFHDLASAFPVNLFSLLNPSTSTTCTPQGPYTPASRTILLSAKNHNYLPSHILVHQPQVLFGTSSSILKCLLKQILPMNFSWWPQAAFINPTLHQEHLFIPELSPLVLPFTHLTNHDGLLVCPEHTSHTPASEISYWLFPLLRTLIPRYTLG